MDGMDSMDEINRVDWLITALINLLLTLKIYVPSPLRLRSGQALILSRKGRGNYTEVRHNNKLSFKNRGSGIIARVFESCQVREFQPLSGFLPFGFTFRFGTLRQMPDIVPTEVWNPRKSPAYTFDGLSMMVRQAHPRIKYGASYERSVSNE